MYVDGPEAPMIVVTNVDPLGFCEMCIRLLAEFFEMGPVLALGKGRTSRVPSVAFPPSGNLPVDFPTETMSNEAFDQRQIGQCTCKVSMTWIAFLVFIDRMGEVLEGLVVPALAARYPPVGRLNVAAGHV